MRLSEWGGASSRILPRPFGCSSRLQHAPGPEHIHTSSSHLAPTQAGFQQNQILSTYPLLPDSGRSDSDLRFGPFGGAARPPTRPGPTGPGRGPPREAGGGGRLSAPAPTCPIELISGRSMAWDCKTGNGIPGILEFKNSGIQGFRNSGI